jgi:DNA polymerase III delta prime subunit
MKTPSIFDYSVISEMVGLDALKQDVQSWYKHEYETSQSALPQALLFHGPPGTGKTSAAHCIARQFLGDDFNSMNFIESNASDDRGIDFIRGSFKTAMRTKGIGVQRKIILLDEADGLTPAAQDAMRQLIEKYAHNAMVILTCNEIEKIRPAIRSRCNAYAFSPVDEKVAASWIYDRFVTYQLITTTEDYTDMMEELKKLVKHMNGDMRATIMFIESMNDISSKGIGIRVDQLVSSSAEDSVAYAINNEWYNLRRNLHAQIKSGRTLPAVLNGFYGDIYSHFEDEDTLDMIWDIMAVYGDTMTHRYTWPGDDYSFLDWMVSKMRKQVNRGNKNE